MLTSCQGQCRHCCWSSQTCCQTCVGQKQHTEQRVESREHLQMTARLHVDRTEAYCIMAKRLGCHVGSEQTMAAWRRASLKRYMSMQRAGCPSRPARPAHMHLPCHMSVLHSGLLEWSTEKRSLRICAHMIRDDSAADNFLGFSCATHSSLSLHQTWPQIWPHFVVTWRSITCLEAALLQDGA